MMPQNRGATICLVCANYRPVTRKDRMLTFFGVERGRELILAHPLGDERHQRQPEQQMQVGPQHAALDVLDHLPEMMMVVPIDADVDEAQHVAQEDRRERRERRPIRAVRHL